jgi:hypothetical protein
MPWIPAPIMPADLQFCSLIGIEYSKFDLA